jgi:hypothetical protein
MPPEPSAEETTRREHESDLMRFPACSMCARILTRRGSWDDDRPRLAYCNSKRTRNICQFCFPIRYYRCCDCGRAGSLKNVHELETYTNPHNPEPLLYKYCASCADRRFVSCALCNSRERIEALMSVNGVNVCAYCYNRDLRVCSHCRKCYRLGSIPGDLRSLGECYTCLSRPKPIESLTFDRNPFRMTVGIELEFCLSALPARFSVTPWGTLTVDASVKPQGLQIGDGREFRSHIYNGDLALDSFTAVCRYLRRSKAYINNSCGFHVHLGVRHLTDQQRENIRAWWERFEWVWFSFVPPARHDNRFCRKQGESAIKARYYALNTLHSLHGTYECRLHPGTLDVSKTCNWVLALLYFFDAATDVPCAEHRTENTRFELIRFFQFSKMPLGIRKYLLSRARHFAHTPLLKPKKPTVKPKPKPSSYYVFNAPPLPPISWPTVTPLDPNP